VSPCPFCRQLAGLEEPSGEVVWRFPHSEARLGLWQFYHGYCVLVARQHATELSGLADEVRRAYLEEMCLLARAIETCCRPHKLNYELLGNQVPHLHWHLFPRSAVEAERLQPVWLALDRAERDPELRRRLQSGPQERAATLADLRQTLQRLNAPSA
jgi:diadenosine tetraphosphate (Ap4A) HIT family hydrolase